MDAIPYEDWATDRDAALLPDGRVAAYESNKALHALDLTSALRHITAPTLVIFGKQDNVALVSDAYLAQKHIPNSQLLLIDECGHFPMYEKRAQYLEAVSAFLA